MKSITTLLEEGAVLGDGGYLIELERRGYVDSGSRREKVGTGKGSGQFTPEVAIENPDALRELHREFLKAGSQVLQALTFFGTREKLDRAGYGAQTEAINHAAVRIARAVAGSVSRTQLIEREGPGALGHAKDLMAEQIRLLKDAGADFLILETFFRLDEMLAALDAAKASGLPAVATLSFHPLITKCSDDHTPAHCARTLADQARLQLGRIASRSRRGCSRCSAKCARPRIFRLPPNPPRSAPPASAAASHANPPSRMIWKPSRFHGASLSNSGKSRRRRASASSVAAVAATRLTSVRWQMVWLRQSEYLNSPNNRRSQRRGGELPGGLADAAGYAQRDGCRW